MTTKISFLSICLAGAAMLSSCGGSAEKGNKDELSDSLVAKTDSATSQVEEEQETSYNLPSALQIAYVFKKSGSNFINTIPNAHTGVNKYDVNNFKRAANFGVYSSDLAYCIFNKKFQESKDYLKACVEVGSFLGLKAAFEGSNLAQRFDKNISNEDSVVKIVSDVQMKTDLMFAQNKQKHITAIAFAGAWTEAVYIASEVYLKNKNGKVLASLLEQLTLAQNIIKALNGYKNTEPEIAGLITSVEKINTAFNAIPSVKTAFEKDEDIDFSSMAVSNDELNALSQSIKELRKTIID